MKFVILSLPLFVKFVQIREIFFKWKKNFKYPPLPQAAIPMK
jgi:hypothetical protein